jgi:hypothetical protein
MTDGTVWSCGYNANGQLGDGTTINSSTLVQTNLPPGKSGLFLADIYRSIPTLTGFSITNLTTGIPYTIIPPNSNSTGVFRYSTSNNQIATISDNTIYTNTLGTFTINATQADTTFYTSATISTTINITCFKEGTKILTNKGYLPIESLRKGDLVKTILHGYIPIDMIGKSEIYHPALQERIKDQLYKCSNREYPEVFEDLIMTGCHSILVEQFLSEEEKQKAIEINSGKLYVTDNRYRLPACADEKSSVYEIPGKYTIYHLALENLDYFMNYGIYANGLLVETCSKRYLKEISGMELIE